MEAYNKLYLDNVIDLHRLVFLTLSEDRTYSFFSLVDEYMRNSDIRRKMDIGNWSALNKGSIQVINSINKNQCKRKPDDELVDPIMAKWIGTIYTYMQWKYNKSSKEISKKVDSHTLYKLYNPLHEVSIEKATEKLYLRFFTEDNIYMTNNTINSFRGEYYFLSNFYEIPVTYKGITYKNNEAAFQAQKCLDPSLQRQFSELNASEAKKLGRRVNLRKDWEEVKVGEMKAIVKAKFSQNKELRKKLFATKEAYLEEGNTWGDKIWGTVNGSGQNLLGQILMQTREELLEKEKIPNQEVTR